MTSRRSSILNQQTIKDAFDTKDINDLVRQFPSSLADNARHSLRLSRGHSTFSSLNSTANPTPGTGRKAGSAEDVTKGHSQSVPRQLPQQGRSKSVVPTSGVFRGPSRISTVKPKTQIKPPQSAQVYRNTKPLSQSKIPMSSQKPPHRDQERKTLTKSVSMESLSWLQTPMVTPRTVKSPRTALLSAGGMDSKSDAVVKNLKIPPSQDKITLNEIYMRVRECLERHGFQIVRQAKAVGCVTIAEYFNMCKFCVQQLMGDHFIEGAKNEELSAKLMEISVDMKYPGQLSKSVLKSPNTPHQWPAALVFLAWLTYTMDKALTPISPKRYLTELTNPEQYLNDQAQESYLNLFFQQISLGDVALDEELERYRQNVLNIYQLDDGVPLADIAVIRAEKLEKLRAIELIPDPRKETLLSTQARLKAIRAAKERYADLQALLEKYMDYDKPRLRGMSLQHALKSADIKLSSLVNDVENQTLSKESETKLASEIEMLRNQRETVEHFNYKIGNEVERRQEYLSNLNDMFYDVCSRLSICDVFNDFLHKLELLRTLEDMERIPRNPLTPAELKPWLKSVNKIRRNTRSIFHKLEQHLASRTDKAVESNLDYENDELVANEALNKLQADIENTEAQQELILQELEHEIAVLNDEIAKCMMELEEVDPDPQPELKAQIEALKRKISRIQAKEAIADNELTMLESKAEAVRLEFEEFEVYAQEELAKKISTYTSRWAELLESDSDDDDEDDVDAPAEFDFEDDEAKVEAEAKAEDKN